MDANGIHRRLSLQILQDGRHAALATLLFCCNPASVFHSGAYTESVFAVLSLMAFNLLSAHSFAAAGIFSLATAARSNGIISACFIVHNGIRRAMCGTVSGAPCLFISSAKSTFYIVKLDFEVID